jgi:hypothetical protein
MSNEFVFVHLGESIPKYLELNIERTFKLFPSTRITLICDNANIQSEYAHLSHYKQTETTREVVSKSHLDKDFRSGFWIKSIERLIAVFEYQVKNQVDRLIHVESDVLLMPNFPIEALGELTLPTWTKYSETKSVGAIVCIPTYKHAEKLLQATLSFISRNTTVTDMTLLNELSKNLKLAETFSHKILDSDQDFDEWRNKEVKFLLSEGFFDPAQIGMWLTGEDPRNHLGMNVIHSNQLFELGESAIDPSKLQYSLDKENNLWAKNTNGVKFPIWSLHIHSKNKKIFERNDSSGLKYFIEISQDLRIKRKLDFVILCGLILDNFKNGTLIAYTKSATKYLLSISGKNGFFLTAIRKRNEKN